ncbi:MAG: hypothetical protein JWM28_3120 [Chitinophagaceae bacterium]|nr:hypothetical protein [Chitinophagaceae bacterium]
MKNLLFLICVFAFIPVIHAQNKLPVIRAGAGQAMIRDGENVKIDNWILDPKAKPDIYYTNVPRKNNKVTFITDRDSISFDTRYGQVYDFVVLKGNDSCYTRISANYQGMVNPDLPGQANGTVSIPFTMRGSRIHFNGTVNGHPGIDIQFDLGAGGCVVNKNSVVKTRVKFDGTTMLTNTQGTNAAPTSANNSLFLAGLRWDHIPLVQTENMKDDEDLIIGNSLFGDKILEIDYDKKIMTVHNRLPAMATSYSSQPVIYDQHRPRIQATVTVEGKNYKDWFTFDTGRDGTMVIGEDFVGRFGLWDKFQTLLTLGNKKIVRIPAVKCGALTFRDIVTNAANPAKPSGRQSLLGNELLNHFNVILDNQQGIIYLKPNSLEGNSYSDWKSFRLKCIGLAAAIIAVITLMIILIRRHIGRKKQ